MKKYRYVIVGGGTTAGYATRELVKKGISKNELCVISNESILPMNRIPFSKSYLSAKTNLEQSLINKEDYYKQHKVDVLTNVEATDIDFDQKTLSLSNIDENIQYDKLLIATGLKKNTFHIEGSQLDGIHYLRTNEDAENIRMAAEKTDKVVVIGGSFIGTEVAASLKQMDKDVTLVFNEERLLSQFSTPEMGIFFKEYLEDKGIKIISNEQVKAFTGDKQVDFVELASGKRLETHLVVAGIGASPNTSLVEDSAMTLDEGIVVNEFCETNIPDIYAAGDVARFPDHFYHFSRRFEHWKNAFEMGKHVAKVMYGYREEYQPMPYIFSELFDLSYDYIGDHSGFDEYIIYGDINKADFSVFWFKQKKMIAAFYTSSRPFQEKQNVMKWIKNQTKLNTAVFTNGSIPFEEAAI